jgi:hypothetical protein
MEHCIECKKVILDGHERIFNMNDDGPWCKACWNYIQRRAGSVILAALGMDTGDDCLEDPNGLRDITEEGGA